MTGGGQQFMILNPEEWIDLCRFRALYEAGVSISAIARETGWASRSVETSPETGATPEPRRKFDQDFKEGAVRLVREIGRPIAQVAKDLEINAGTLANWVALDRQARDGGGRLDENGRLELARLRWENADLAMERDVLSAVGSPR